MRLALDETTRSLIARLTAEAAPVESLTPRQARQAQEARRARAVEQLVEVDRVAEWTIPGAGDAEAVALSSLEPWQNCQ